MAGSDKHQAPSTLCVLASDRDLAAQAERVAIAAGATVTHCDDLEPVQGSPGQAACAAGGLAWLVEASLVGSRFSEAEVIEALDGAADILLVGDAGERERLSHWLSEGKAQFLRLPLDGEYLAELLGDIRSERSAEGGAAHHAIAPELDQYGLLYGSADVMHDLYRQLRKASRTDAALLICGESGTGKELIARSVHSYSDRSEEGFESINCSAIPEDLMESELFGHEKGSFTGAERTHRGLFERAGSGTLFLDEITEMPPSAQAKLLRVLESGVFRRVGGREELRSRARIMSASNRDPQVAIDSGELRPDLYYRICQMEVHAPPLRDRGADVIRLAHLFARLYSRQTGHAVRLDPDAESALLEHSWPGNVRELRHCILGAARLSRGHIGAGDILESRGGSLTSDDPDQREGMLLRAGMTIADAERRLIELTLQETGGHKERAARKLGISVRTLYNRLARYAKEGGA